MKRFILVSCCTIFSLIIFTGCGTKEAVKKISDEDAIRERVMAYWDYRVKEEYDKAYQLEYPLFRKETKLATYMRYLSNPTIKYGGFKIDEIQKTDTDTAMVTGTVNVSLKPFGAKPLVLDSTLSERWVRVDGEWFHVPTKTSTLTHEPTGKGGDGEER